MSDDSLTVNEGASRVMHRIENHGDVCIDCGESPTADERVQPWCYCFACWPLEDRERDLDGEITP